MLTGRDPNRLDALRRLHPRVSTLIADYSDLRSFHDKLSRFKFTTGSPDLVLAWIHGEAAPVIQKIGLLMDKPWRMFQVLGSASDASEIRNRVEPGGNCTYRTIQLGYKRENDQSRWLTDVEISAGAIEAISENKDVLVGQLEPWELRP